MRTDEGVLILLQAQAGDKVGDLLLGPVGDEAGGAGLAVSRVGEGGGRVLGAHGPGRGGRALWVVDGEGRALDDAALVLVAGLVVLVRVVVVLGRVCHRGGAGEGEGRARSSRRYGAVRCGGWEARQGVQVGRLVLLDAGAGCGPPPSSVDRGPWTVAQGDAETKRD